MNEIVWSELGIKSEDVTPSVFQFATEVANELVEPGVKGFSIMVIAAIVGVIIEAIKLYRDCNKTPDEVMAELRNSFPIWRPLRRMTARRLVRKYMKAKEIQAELGGEVTLDAFTNAAKKADPGIIRAMMGA